MKSNGCSTSHPSRVAGSCLPSIRRSDVAALLDHVEDGHGARQADTVIAVVASIMNWYAARHDNYVPVIARGMRRQNKKAQARKPCPQ